MDIDIPEGYKVRYIKGRGPARIRGKTILIPEWETRRHRQESLAHEVAHISLGHTSGEEGEESIYEFLPKEIEAQKFGRKLLGRRKRIPPTHIARIIENTTEFINRGAKEKISIAAIAEIFWEDSGRLGLPRGDVEKAINILRRRGLV